MDSANSEEIEIVDVSSFWRTVDVKNSATGGGLQNDYQTSRGAAIIWPIAGLSGSESSPIWVVSGNSTITQVKETIAHEIGHTTGEFQDITVHDHIMFYSTSHFGEALRYRSEPLRYTENEEKQWDRTPR